MTCCINCIYIMGCQTVDGNIKSTMDKKAIDVKKKIQRNLPSQKAQKYLVFSNILRSPS